MQYPGRTVREASGRLVQVGSVRVPRLITLDELGDNGYPDVRLRFEVRDGRPDCVEITFKAKPDGRGLRSGDLTGLSVDSYVRNVFAELARPVDGPNVPFLLHAMDAVGDPDPI